MILRWKSFLEKVQDDWFEKNPNFYVNKRQMKKKNDIDITTQKKLESLKKTKIDEIKFNKIENYYTDVYTITNPEFLKGINFMKTTYGYFEINQFTIYPTYYKIYVSFINYINDNTIEILIPQQLIHKTIQHINNYYIVVYKTISDYVMFLSKTKDDFIKKIKNIKNKYKIYYVNNKIKGKDFTDYENLDINKIKNKLKRISYDDITFRNDNNKYYDVVFLDKELNDKVKKYNLITDGFFIREDYGYGTEIIVDTPEYFGHLRNRFHSGNLSNKIKNIGLGYKIYKSFIKYMGYIISDDKTTPEARKIYYYLLKDDDIYHVIDKENNRILLIWKNYPKIKKLLNIIRNHEKKNNLHYDYDKRLMNYLK
jgi:hypothetical protein